MQRQENYELRKKQIPALFEKMRLNAIPIEQKHRYMQEALTILEQNIAEYAHSPVESRVIQLIIQDGSKEQTNRIKDLLIPQIENLLSSKYGRFVAVELLNTQRFQSAIITVQEVVLPQADKLLTNAISNITMNSIYSNANQALRNQIVNSLIAQSTSLEPNYVETKAKENPQVGIIYVENLKRIIEKCESKMMLGSIVCIALLQQAFSLYLNNEELRPMLAETLSFLQNLEPDQFMQLIDTREGAEVACYIFTQLPAKGKRGVITELKHRFNDLLVDPYASLLMTILFTLVDDTVVVGESFIDFYQQKIVQILTTSTLIPIPMLGLSGLVSVSQTGKCKCCSSELIPKVLKNCLILSSCKKPIEKRQEELRQMFIAILNKAMADDAFPQIFLKKNMASEVLVEAAPLLDAKLLKKILTHEENGEPILLDNFGHFNLKKLVKCLGFNAALKADIAEYVNNLKSEGERLKLLKEWLQ